MTGGLLSTPRPMPGRRVPVIAGACVVVLALPVFLLGGLPLEGWGIAAALWAVFQVIGLLLGRLRVGIDTVASAGVVGIGRTLRAAGLVVVLFVVAATNRDVGLAAVVVYALAFTAELVSSLLLYVSGKPVEWR